jgi:hypothetical protein
LPGCLVAWLPGCLVAWLPLASCLTASRVLHNHLYHNITAVSSCLLQLLAACCSF